MESISSDKSIGKVNELIRWWTELQCLIDYATLVNAVSGIATGISLNSSPPRFA